MMKTLRGVLAVLLVANLSGCVTDSKTFGPDGREAHTITCHGLAQSWGDCYKKAGDVCGAAGYDVISQNGETGAVASANGSSAFAANTISRSLLMECKRP